MNKKALIPLIAGLCIGGFALKFGLDTVKRARASQETTVQVWTARDDIPRGATIQEPMVQADAYPAKLVPKGAITMKENLIGRVPRVAAPAGLPVLDSMLLPPGTRPGIFVKPGFRAVAIKVDESSGVDNHLEPGCRVDVIGYFTIRRDNKQETIARTLIENVEVAAVGQHISPPSDDPKKGKEGAEKPARAVTLLVQPEKVPELHLAEQRGKLKLSMRSSDDLVRIDDTSTTTEQEVLGEPAAPPTTGKAMDSFLKMFAGKPGDDDAKKPTPAAPAPTLAAAPVPAPDPGWPVVIWNGNTRNVRCFKNADSMEYFDMSGGAGQKSRGRASPTPAPMQPTASPAPTANPPDANAPAPAASPSDANTPAPVPSSADEPPVVSDDPEPEPEELHE